MIERVAVTILAAAIAAPLLAQSLAGVAARDRERRARSGAPAPVYTDTDLRASPSPSPSPSPVATPPPAAGTAGKPRGWRAPTAPSPASTGASGSGTMATPAPTPEPPDRSAQERASRESQWRAIAAQRRDQLAKAEAQVGTLEARVAALRSDLSPVNVADPNREQNRRAAIAAAVAELEGAQAALAEARKAVDDLEDDVRRAGGLPGWVR